MSARALVRLAAALGAAAALAGCGAVRANTAPAADPTPPEPMRETRGLWIATVGNIDWPSKPGLTAAQQQAELRDLFDRAQRAGINAVFFHVRPNADAVYRSALEPIASMLSGKQGDDPGYDPLELAVREAHARGIQLHAWINPYRAGNVRDSSKFAANGVVRARPDLVRVYGGAYWMDPGEPDVLDRTIAASLDIVRRYDVDGIHADDYFYPYQVLDSNKVAVPFPDSLSYAKYGNGQPRDDWRRDNVNRLIQRLQREVHAAKPWVQVGMSPFGIWRPGNPASVAGLDAYATLYADSRRWLQEGWVDYLAPQLYWAIAAPQQSYPALLDWWVSQSTLGRPVWPGLATYRETDTTRASHFAAGEIARQIELARQRPLASGHIMFNATTTLKTNDEAIAKQLRTLYARPAVPPAMPWLDQTPGAPGAPLLLKQGGSLAIAPAPGEAARWWFVRVQGAHAWTSRLVFGTERAVPLPDDARWALVQAVDAAGTLGPVAEWRR